MSFPKNFNRVGDIESIPPREFEARGKKSENPSQGNVILPKDTPYDLLGKSRTVQAVSPRRARGPNGVPLRENDIS